MCKDVCLCCAWGPDGSHIGSSSCLFDWKKCGRGQKERLARRGGSAPWQEAPPAVQDPTSAARPVLPNLKAVSAETEGAVSSHDAAIAAPELVAGWQQLCRGDRKKGAEKKGYKWVGGIGTYFFDYSSCPSQVCFDHSLNECKWQKLRMLQCKC